MNEINLKIIELIKENKGIKEISSILNMSEKQLFVRIKQIINYGYKLNSMYYYNGDISYNLSKTYKNDNKNNIRIELCEKEFRCIAISDMHIGNKDSDIDLLKKVYEYAANNNINIIFNCGDLIEGVHTTDKRSIDDIYKQIDYLIKKYPYDKNINNFMILGNHDFHSLHYDGLDLCKKINNSRYDLIPIGFGQGVVNLKEDKLALNHELSLINMPKLDESVKVVLVGHGHMMKTKLYDRLLLCLPSLSYVSPDKTKEIIPGFMDLSISFDRDKFEFIKAKQMIITPKVIMASESRCRMKSLFKNINK